MGFVFCCYTPPFTGHPICARKVQLCTQRHHSDTNHDISMGKCKKDVTPLLTHWSYVFLALTRRFAFVYTRHTVMCLNSWNLKFVNRLCLISPLPGRGGTHYVREMSKFRSIDPPFSRPLENMYFWHTPFFQDAGESIDIRPPFSNSFPQTSTLHPPPPHPTPPPTLHRAVLQHMIFPKTLTSIALIFGRRLDTAVQSSVFTH